MMLTFNYTLKSKEQRSKVFIYWPKINKKEINVLASFTYLFACALLYILLLVQCKGSGMNQTWFYINNAT